MNESRFIKYDKRRLPRQKRTIRLFGAVAYDQSGHPVKDQSDKLYRCWHCGHLCNEQHSNIKLGDGVGFYITDKAEEYSPNNAAFQYPNENPMQSCSIFINTASTPRLMQLDSVGTQMTVVHNNTQIVTQGCPLCGCKNYR